MISTVNLLEKALEFIRDEEHWTTGSLFENVDIQTDPLCRNVRVCARGALTIAAFGPEITQEKRLNILRDGVKIDLVCGDGMDKHPMTREAFNLLDKYAAELYEAYNLLELNDGNLTVAPAAQARHEQYGKIKAVFHAALNEARENEENAKSQSVGS